MKKQFLIFSTLCVGLLTILWVCAQTENTKKTPGEQLLEFMKDPPKKYDVGGSVEYFLGKKRTNYFRILWDGDFSLFDGKGTNSEIIFSKGLCDLEKYKSIFSKYNEYFYSLDSGTFMTWTNSEKQSLENRFSKEYCEQFEIQKNELFPLASFLQNSKFLDKDRFDISDPNGGTRNGRGFLERDSDGRIIHFAFLKKSAKNKSDTSSDYSSGWEYSFEYTENVGLDFYPNIIKLGLIYNKQNQLITNLYSTHHFHHISLDPHFEKSQFTIEPPKDMPLKRLWVSGTNTVFFNLSTKELDGALFNAPKIE